MAWRADGAAPSACAAPLRPDRPHGDAAGGASADAAAELESLLGMRLRRLRQAHRWSLDELAARAGVSRAMLGQIELGRSTPTVRVLMRIAAGFGVDPAALLAPAQPRLHVLRAERGAASRDPRPALRALGTVQPGAAAFHALRLPPGSTASHPDTARPCRFNAVVAQGTVEVAVGGETLRLDRDDALEVDTTTPLHWRNAGEGTALIHAVWSSDR